MTLSYTVTPLNQHKMNMKKRSLFFVAFMFYAFMWILNMVMAVEFEADHLEHVDVSDDSGHVNIIDVDDSTCSVQDKFKENCMHSEAKPNEKATNMELQGNEGSEHETHTICDSPPPSPSPDDWRLVTDRPVYTFSAFFDEREIVNGPLVRVTALGLQRSHVTVGDMYCQFHASNGLRNTSISCEASYSKIYPSTAHADEYTAHWLECPYPQSLISTHGYPHSIAIVAQLCEEPSYSLNVKYKKKERSGFGLCLPSIYQGDDAVGFAEWIVLHKLLGYQSIYMYNGRGHIKSNSKTAKVLNLYKNGYDKNISVDLIEWNFPPVHTFYFAQHSVINDCLYRMAIDHKHVTVCDKDEVVMPLKHPSIPDFIKSIETELSAAYMAQHEMFNTNQPNQMSKEIEEIIRAHGIKDVDGSYLTTLKYTSHMSRPYPEEKIRSKTIYNVDRTISADVHFPKYLAKGFQEKLIPEDQAVVYHYRIPPNNDWLNAVPYVNETRIDMFQHQLLTEVTEVVKRAGIL